MDATPLTNWGVNDAEDEAALQAAGLGSRSRLIKIGIVAVLFVGFYSYMLNI